MKRIKNLDLPNCPYCGENVWYAEAFLAKNRSFYKCKHCKEKSEVRVDPEAFKLLGISEFIAIIIFAAAVLMEESYSILGFFVIVAVFAVFYAFSPFMMHLFKAKKKKKKRKKNLEEDEFDDDFAIIKKEAGNDTETEIYSN